MATYSRRRFLGLTAAGAATTAAAAVGLTGCGRFMGDDGDAAARRCARRTGPPNFVFILVDDMGWRDLGAYGSTFHHTPHLDRLAAEGMRFTDAYAACPVCSPTRAAILTGRYPARLDLTDWIPGLRPTDRRFLVPPIHEELPHEERTLAEALAPAGYVSAAIGKWHLGHTPHYPETQGFDHSFAAHHRGRPNTYFAPYDGLPEIADAEEGEHLTDRLTRDALEFLDRNADRPFFMYLSHYAVHRPIEAPPEDVERIRGRHTDPALPQRDPVFAALVEGVDRSTGRVLDKLDELGLSDNTVVVFTSDNGGLLPESSMLPLHGWKGTLYEGGLRVPLMVRWPGRVAAGSISHEPVTSVDYFPTLLEMAGVELPNDRVIDGVSLTPVLLGREGLGRDAIFWHHPHYHNQDREPGAVIREGHMKLIDFFDPARIELYDLDADIAERHNLADERPEQTRRLHRRLLDWQASVEARAMIPNPNFVEP